MLSRRRSGMQFYGDVLVLFRGKVINEEVFKNYRAQWGETNNSGRPEHGYRHTDYTDEEIVCALMDKSVPFLVFQAEGTPLVLDVEFARFQDPMLNFEYANFALRMVPQEGAIRRVVLYAGTHMAVNALVHTEDGVYADLGNGKLRFELLYKPPDGVLDPLAQATSGPCLNEDLKKRKKMFVR